MQSDQELIIMCKPPEPTVIQNKAAGFAGSLYVNLINFSICFNQNG